MLRKAGRVFVGTTEVPEDGIIRLERGWVRVGLESMNDVRHHSNAGVRWGYRRMLRRRKTHAGRAMLVGQYLRFDERFAAKLAHPAQRPDSELDVDIAFLGGRGNGKFLSEYVVVETGALINDEQHRVGPVPSFEELGELASALASEYLLFVKALLQLSLSVSFLTI